MYRAVLNSFFCRQPGLPRFSIWRNPSLRESCSPAGNLRRPGQANFCFKKNCRQQNRQRLHRFPVWPLPVFFCHLFRKILFTELFYLLVTPSPSSLYFARRAAAGPDSPKTSCTPIFFTGTGHFSASASQTALPRPPITECSSTVTTLPVSFAAATISSSSSGLMVWMLMILASMPSAASFSAASRAELTQRPVATMVTSLPSRRTTPFPSSNL